MADSRCRQRHHPDLVPPLLRLGGRIGRRCAVRCVFGLLRAHPACHAHCRCARSRRSPGVRDAAVIPARRPPPTTHYSLTLTPPPASPDSPAADTSPAAPAATTLPSPASPPASCTNIDRTAPAHA